MNAAVQQIPGAAGATTPNGVSFITGKIVGKRVLPTQSGRLHLTLVKLPSIDEYSTPSTVELRSEAQLGDVGDTVKVKVQIGGFPRQFNSKPDPETGEVRLVRTSEVRLTVIA